jgi:hypothetical protein
MLETRYLVQKYYYYILTGLITKPEIKNTYFESFQERELCITMNNHKLKIMVVQVVKKFPAFMEPENILPCSKEARIVPVSEPGEFLTILFNNIHPSIPRFSFSVS